MKLSINKNLISKQANEIVARYEKYFENTDLGRMALSEVINRGYAYAPQFNEGRCKNNFSACGYVSLDFDSGWLLDDIFEHPLVKEKAAIVYKTPSHLKDGITHKFRVLFELPEAIYQADEYEKVVAAFIAQFKPSPDKACKDAARMFFGSKDSNPTVLGGQLNKEDVDTIIAQYQATSNNQAKKKTVMDLLSNNEPILEGERHTQLVRVAGLLRNQGRTDDEIYDFLQKVNKSRCQPELSDKEIGEIAKSISRYEPDDNNNRALELNLLAQKIIMETPIITSSSSNSYKYEKPIWKPLKEAELNSLALQVDKKEKTSRNRRSEISAFIRAATYKGEIPWNDIKSHQIAFNNGVYDIITGQLLPFEKEYYLDSVLPHAHSALSPCPTWFKCLNEWLGDAEDKITALQEFFGYILMSHAKYKKALLCFGPSNTGKSVVSKVIYHVVGPENVCNIKLDKLSSPRDIAPIKGKKANIVTELPPMAKMAEDGFKQLVSNEDPVQLDAKYAQPELYIPTCKHAVFTNELPQIVDYSDAVYNRLLIIPFDNVIPEKKQDPDLEETLKAEVQGIISWALEGAKRLYEKKGYFTAPESSIEILKQYKLEQNPVKKWAEQNLVPENGRKILFQKLFDKYREDSNLYRLSSDRFSKLLKSAGYVTHRGRLDGSIETYLEGYRFIDEVEDPKDVF